MLNSKESLFDKLKRRSPYAQKRENVSEVFFQLLFVENRACLFVVDKNKQEIKVDYRSFSGLTRDILKSVETIKAKRRFTIRWDESDHGTDLTENSFLIWQLKRSNRFVDENLTPIEIDHDLAELTLVIKGDTQLECELSIQKAKTSSEKSRFVNENHVFHEGTLYTIKPTGADYSLISSFETLILRSELQAYLSLFYSYCENVSVKFNGFSTTTGPQKTSGNTLVFEKVTRHNTLYLRICSSLPGFEPGFLDDYDLSKVAYIDDLEQTITVHELIQGDIFSARSQMEKTLTKLKNTLRGVEDSDFFLDDNLFIIEAVLAKALVQDELPGLISHFSIFGSDHLKPYNVHLARPEINVSLKHGIDFLEGEARLSVNGETFSLFEALHQYRNHSYIQLNDGNKALLHQDYVEKLERVFQEKDNGNVEVSFFDMPLVEEIIDNKTSAPSLTKSRAIFEGFNTLKHNKYPTPNINARFRSYQLEGFTWLKYLESNSLGGCLADDMGLGKTLQAIALLSSIYPEQGTSSLIVIPKSLIFNWQNEFQKFNPDISIYLYYGNGRDIEQARKHHVVITTYSTVRIDIDILRLSPFYYVILDESQNIKNVNSQVSRAVVLLQSENRLALSGTPIENNLSELYSLFRFLNPAMFGGFETFSRRYLLPIQQNTNSAAAKELKSKIHPFILRRLKKDVLKDLPEKIEQVLYVEMSEEQQKFYEQRRVFYYNSIMDHISEDGFKRSTFFILQAITVLRQIASIPEVKSDGQIRSPKRDMLLEYLPDSISNGHKILLFSNFLSVLDYLASDLKGFGIDYETMTGATRDRMVPVRRFKEDQDCKVFLMTLKTGGQGLNLTEADTVFIFDPWWNIAAENQSIDRSHRIGQDKTVFSYKLIAKGTIEEKILQLQTQKKALFETIISNDSISEQLLSEEEIDFILG